MKPKRLAIVFGVLLLLIVASPVTAPAQGKGKPCQVAVDVTLRDATDHRVRSDGLGTYFEDADILCDGRFYLLWERTITFDLTQPADAGSPTLGPFAVSGNVGIEIAETDGLLGMDVPETNQTTKVQFNFVVGNTRYLLQLGSNYGQDVADVRRTGAGTWEIEAASTDKARLVACPARGKCSTPTIVGYYYVPFQMNVEQE